VSKPVKSVRLDRHIESALENAAEDRDEEEADTAREVMKQGLERMGYLDENDTTLEIVCHEVVKFAMYSALVVLALALGTQLDGLATVGAVMFLIGVLAYAIETNEPEITQRLRRFQA